MLRFFNYILMPVLLLKEDFKYRAFTCNRVTEYLYCYLYFIKRQYKRQIEYFFYPCPRVAGTAATHLNMKSYSKQLCVSFRSGQSV